MASSDDRFVIEEEGIERFDLAEVGVVLYLPICLEVEETLLYPISPGRASRKRSGGR